MSGNGRKIGGQIKPQTRSHWASIWDLIWRSRSAEKKMEMILTTWVNKGYVYPWDRDGRREEKFHVFSWNWSMQEFIFYQRFELLKQKREKKNQKITTRWEKIKDDVNDLGEHVLLLSLRARWATRKGFHETERYINCVAIRDLARRNLSAEENWKIMLKMWMNRNLFYVWRLKKEAQEVKFQLEMIWKELVLEFRLTDHERGEKLKKLYQ